MVVKFKKLRTGAKCPSRGSEYAAGYDLYADIEDKIEILPHETKPLPTGISIEIPPGYYGGVYARSGLASKEGLRPANCVGIIDADYRGELFVMLHNDGDSAREVCPDERVAQLLVLPFMEVEFEEADALSETGRGSGGFGSTGKE